jgi:hypothetical protein
MSAHSESTASKSTASHKHTSSSSKEGDTMTIQALKTSMPAIPSSTDGAAATASSPVPTAATKTPVTALGVGLLPLPPNVTIPSPPQGYEPTSGVAFRGVFPWTAEIVLLPKALKDLARFTTYANVLGGTAPPLALVVEAFTVGGEWSTVRGASAAWDAYCRDQEGSAWRLINALLDRLRPAFALAVQGDASVATTYPSLAELLAVKKVSARKGASARKNNKKADAAGEPTNHGAAGKAREKKAAKEALAAAKAAAMNATPQEAAASSAPVTSPAAPKAAGTTAQ